MTTLGQGMDGVRERFTHILIQLDSVRERAREIDTRTHAHAHARTHTHARARARARTHTHTNVCSTLMCVAH